MGSGDLGDAWSVRGPRRPTCWSEATTKAGFPACSAGKEQEQHKHNFLGFSLTRLWTPSPLPPLGPCFIRQPLSLLYRQPSSLLVPPHQQLNILNTCLPLTKEKRLLIPYHPPAATLPPLKAICTPTSHFRWTFQIHSNLASEPTTKFTSTFLLLNPRVSFQPHFIYPLVNSDYY